MAEITATTPCLGGAPSLASAPTSQARAPPQPAWPYLPPTCWGLMDTLPPTPGPCFPSHCTCVSPITPLSPVPRPGFQATPRARRTFSLSVSRLTLSPGFWWCPLGAHRGLCWGQWTQQAAGSSQAAPHARAPSGHVTGLGLTS